MEEYVNYLDTLVAEVAAVTDEQIASALPTNPVGETDKLLGTASRDVLALLVVAAETAAQHNALIDRLQAAEHMKLPPRETRALMNEVRTLKKKYKTLDFLLWQSVKTEFPLPDDARGQSFRENGQVVAIYQTDEAEDGLPRDVLLAEALSFLFGAGQEQPRRPGIFRRMFH